MAVNRSIQEILAAIRSAIYGKDVRTAIADGIEKCYSETAQISVSQIGQTDDYLLILTDQ